MTKSEYNSKRSFAIRLFGIAMIIVSLFVLITAPSAVLHEQKHTTEYVMGEVTAVDGDEIKIYYILPGEDEGWLVTKHGEGWSKGDEVRVYYNPDDLSEKYIEGFDEQSPWGYVALGIGGLALGLIALVVASAAKKSKGLNEVLDMVDRG